MSNMYEDPIYDEVGTSYDSSIPSEVQDQDNYSDNVDEYYQEHEMQSDVHDQLHKPAVVQGNDSEETLEIV
ncbi:hypothetical protein Tco_0375573 [Tanacetum coccineum]